MYKLRRTRKTRKIDRRKHIKRGGGQLPSAPAGIVKLPSLSSLKNMYKNPIKNLNQNGGFLPKEYIGSTWGNLQVSNFPISDQNILDFRRISSRKHTDCVISALQIIGILDFFSANILRITKIASGAGIDENEIELIFSLRTNKRFLFIPTSNITEFSQYIKTHILPSNIAFCGVTRSNGIKHVFLIGKDSNGNIIKIDPQAPNPYCFLETDQECYRIFSQNTLKYWLLFNYTGELSPYEANALGIQADATFVPPTPPEPESPMDVDNI
jgi:hypothetical protein